MPLGIIGCVVAGSSALTLIFALALGELVSWQLRAAALQNWVARPKFESPPLQDSRTTNSRASQTALDARSTCWTTALVPPPRAEAGYTLDECESTTAATASSNVVPEPRMNRVGVGVFDGANLLRAAPYAATVRSLSRQQLTSRDWNADFGKVLYLEAKNLYLVDQAGIGCLNRLFLTASTEFARGYNEISLQVEIDGDVVYEIDLLRCCFGEEDGQFFPRPLVMANMELVSGPSADVAERVAMMKTGSIIAAPMCYERSVRVSLKRKEDSARGAFNAETLANTDACFAEWSRCTMGLYWDADIEALPRPSSAADWMTPSSAFAVDWRTKAVLPLSLLPAATVLSEPFQRKVALAPVKSQHRYEQGEEEEAAGFRGIPRSLLFPLDVKSIAITVRPLETQRFFELSCGSSGVIRALLIKPCARKALRSLWLRVTFDGATTPQIEAPLTLLFLENIDDSVKNAKKPFHAATMGYDSERGGYVYYPAPFWSSVRMELVSVDPATAHDIHVEVHYTLEETYDASTASYLHVRTKTVQTEKYGFEENVIWSTEESSGYLAATVIELAEADSQFVIEQDILFRCDFSEAPQIWESGFEDYFNAGHGYGYRNYASGPLHGWQRLDKDLANPLRPGSGKSRNAKGGWGECHNFRQYRIHLGERLNWYSHCTATLEGNDATRTTAVNTMIISYEQARATIVRSDRWTPKKILFSNTNTATAAPVNDLELEWTKDVEGTYNGYGVNGICGAAAVEQKAYPASCLRRLNATMRTLSCTYVRKGRIVFQASIDSRNKGVFIRRTIDLHYPWQSGEVFVDGSSVGEWRSSDRTDSFTPDTNFHDQEILIAEALTQGKTTIAVEVVVDMPAIEAAHPLREDLAHLEQRGTFTSCGEWHIFSFL